MEYTTNLQLKKQAENEFYDIEVMNENLDKIDGAVGKTPGFDFKSESYTKSCQALAGNGRGYVEIPVTDKVIGDVTYEPVLFDGVYTNNNNISITTMFFNRERKVVEVGYANMTATTISLVQVKAYMGLYPKVTE